MNRPSNDESILGPSGIKPYTIVLNIVWDTEEGGIWDTVVMPVKTASVEAGVLEAMAITRVAYEKEGQPVDGCFVVTVFPGHHEYVDPDRYMHLNDPEEGAPPKPGGGILG